MLIGDSGGVVTVCSDTLSLSESQLNTETVCVISPLFLSSVLVMSGIIIVSLIVVPVDFVFFLFFLPLKYSIRFSQFCFKELLDDDPTFERLLLNDDLTFERLPLGDDSTFKRLPCNDDPTLNDLMFEGLSLDDNPKRDAG